MTALSTFADVEAIDFLRSLICTGTKYFDTFSKNLTTQPRSAILSWEHPDAEAQNALETICGTFSAEPAYDWHFGRHELYW